MYDTALKVGFNIGFRDSACDITRAEFYIIYKRFVIPLLCQLSGRILALLDLKRHNNVP